MTGEGAVWEALQRRAPDWQVLREDQEALPERVRDKSGPMWPRWIPNARWFERQPAGLPSPTKMRCKYPVSSRSSFPKINALAGGKFRVQFPILHNRNGSTILAKKSTYFNGLTACFALH
jgi:hypothetical protein